MRGIMISIMLVVMCTYVPQSEAFKVDCFFGCMKNCLKSYGFVICTATCFKTCKSPTLSAESCHHTCAASLGTHLNKNSGNYVTNLLLF